MGGDLAYRDFSSALPDVVGPDFLHPTGIAAFVGVLDLGGLLEPLPADLQQLWVWACCATRWKVDL